MVGMVYLVVFNGMVVIFWKSAPQGGRETGPDDTIQG